MPENPKPIINKEIGRYFCEFKGTHYKPNEALASIYSHDVLYLSDKYDTPCVS